MKRTSTELQPPVTRKCHSNKGLRTLVQACRLRYRALPLPYENRFGEQFVFTFDRTTSTGTVSGGDLDWGNPRPFTLVEIEAIVQDMRGQVEEAVRQEGLDPARVPELDAALALGRLTGVTGKDEIIWLRACLRACRA